MKNLKNYLKSISYLLTFLILLQGCTVYKKTGVTLEEASRSELKAIVEKTDGIKLTFKRIEEGNDGNYYGIENRIVNGEWTDTATLLNKNYIYKVRIKKRSLSTIATIGSSLAVATFIGAIIFAVSWNGFF